MTMLPISRLLAGYFSGSGKGGSDTWECSKEGVAEAWDLISSLTLENEAEPEYLSLSAG